MAVFSSKKPYIEDIVFHRESLTTGIDYPLIYIINCQRTKLIIQNSIRCFLK